MQAFIRNKYSNKRNNTLSDCPWWYALEIIDQKELWQNKFGDLLKKLPNDNQLYTKCRALVLNVLKHRTFLLFCLEQKLKRRPKSLMENFLLVSSGELLKAFVEKRGSQDIIKIFATHVNGWLDKAKMIFSTKECGFINAMLRGSYETFDNFFKNRPPKEIFYSTPKWLIDRWEKSYGIENTEKLLQINQLNNTSYIRAFGDLSPFSCDFLQKTQFKNFYKADNSNWFMVKELLDAGVAYIQDPMTTHPVELLDVHTNMSVLDLCAAPGGKSVQLAEKLKGSGILVSVDLPGKRMHNLHDNLKNIKSSNATVLAKDVLNLSSTDFAQQNLPSEFDRVLIDVPCSNTGVIGRKPDVKFRLRQDDFKKLISTQLQLLTAASKFVKNNGLLVYSTCSIEPDENQEVVGEFLKEKTNFSLVSQHISLPWESECDGGGAFALRRKN